MCVYFKIIIIFYLEIYDKHFLQKVGISINTCIKDKNISYSKNPPIVCERVCEQGVESAFLDGGYYWDFSLWDLAKII